MTTHALSGASLETLLRRCQYGGRKGQRALRRLTTHGVWIYENALGTRVAVRMAPTALRVGTDGGSDG